MRSRLCLQLFVPHIDVRRLFNVCGRRPSCPHASSKILQITEALPYAFAQQPEILCEYRLLLLGVSRLPLYSLRYVSNIFHRAPFAQKVRLRDCRCTTKPLCSHKAPDLSELIVIYLMDAQLDNAPDELCQFFPNQMNQERVSHIRAWSDRSARPLRRTAGNHAYLPSRLTRSKCDHCHRLPIVPWAPR